LGLVGVLLALIAIVTGVVTMLMVFALDAGRFVLFVRSLGSRRDGIEDVAQQQRPASPEQSELPARRNIRFVMLIAFVSAVINVTVLTFLFSPLGQNPIAILVVAVTGGVTTIFVLRVLTARGGREWLKVHW
jgi:uncharacterized membrane protein YbhN (UPF0104 family)